MPLKRYESRYVEEYIVLTLASGKNVNIAFKGGGVFPRVHGGSYYTDNLEIQEALEARKDFDKKWKITLNTPTKEEKLIPKEIVQIPIDQNKNLVPPPALPPVPDTLPEPVPPVEPPAPAEPELPIEPPAPVEPSLPVEPTTTPEPPALEIPVEGSPATMLVTDVVNFQQVRSYLCQKFQGTTFAEVRSKEAAKKFAAERNVTFPNWIE